MENQIREFIGKRADIYCGNSSVFRGKVESVDGGIVRIADDSEKVIFVNVAHVIAISGVLESASRPGFVG